MRRWARALPLLVVAACSGLDEGEGGVVALELETPEFLEIEVGEQVELVARALDADGELVDVGISWRSSSDAVTVDGAGIVTGAQPGLAAEIAVRRGDHAHVDRDRSRASEPLDFTVQASADTLIVVGDSVLVIPIGADPPVTAGMTVRLESLTLPGPAESRPVIFEITSPPAGTAPVVQLLGGAQGDTVLTATDGTATVTLEAVPGQVPPDTAIVEVRAERLRGAAVPGSGQHFYVLFQ